MRRAAKKISVLAAVLVLVFWGCEQTQSPSSGTDENTAKPQLVGYEITDFCGEYHPAGVSVSGCEINVHNSLLSGSSVDSLKVRMETDGNTIDLYEQIFQSEFGDSLCYYTFSIDIVAFGNGQYRINVFKQINGGTPSFEWSNTVNVTDCAGE